MDLLNMTIKAQIHELYKKVNGENFYFSSHSFLLGGGGVAARISAQF